MADYLTAFHAAFLQDSVQFGFEVSEGSLVKRSADGLFEVSGRRSLGGPLGADTPAAPLEQRLVARRVVMATGNGADYLPPIPVSTDRLQTILLAAFSLRRVLCFRGRSWRSRTGMCRGRRSAMRARPSSSLVRPHRPPTPAII